MPAADIHQSQSVLTSRADARLLLTPCLTDLLPLCVVAVQVMLLLKEFRLMNSAHVRQANKLVFPEMVCAGRAQAPPGGLVSPALRLAEPRACAAAPQLRYVPLWCLALARCSALVGGAKVGKKSALLLYFTHNCQNNTANLGKSADP